MQASRRVHNVAKEAKVSNNGGRIEGCSLFDNGKHIDHGGLRLVKISSIFATQKPLTFGIISFGSVYIQYK